MNAIQAPARRLVNAGVFFDDVRALTGPLDGTQVEIINLLLAAASSWSTAWLAYGLATAWHEARLRPIEEFGRGRGKPYGRSGVYGGQVPYGRGLVQLTWDVNYARADHELGLHGALLADFSKALEPDVAVGVLVRGMSEGWFTGKSLGSYLPLSFGTSEQLTAARRIINGQDCAAMIAGYAQRFQAALVAGAWA